MSEELKPITSRQIHDISNFISDTNTNITRILMMLDFLAPQVVQPTSIETILVKVGKAHGTLSGLLDAAHADFLATEAYQDLCLQQEKLQNLIDHGGGKVPQASIKICLQIDIQIKNLTKSGIKLRKEALRDVRFDITQLWLAAVRFNLQHLHKFGRETLDSINANLSHKELGCDIEFAVPFQMQDVEEIVRYIADQFRSKLKAKGIKLRIKIKDVSGASNLVDPEGMAEALHELMSNASKYMGELPVLSKFRETWVEVRAEADENFVQIAVESWGPPLTKTEAETNLLFGKGTRGHFAKAANISGNGLGLARVKEIMSNNDGQIEIVTRPVEKSSLPKRPAKITFVLRFPGV